MSDFVGSRRGTHCEVCLNQGGITDFFRPFLRDDFFVYKKIFGGFQYEKFISQVYPFSADKSAGQTVAQQGNRKSAGLVQRGFA